MLGVLGLTTVRYWVLGRDRRRGSAVRPPRLRGHRRLEPHPVRRSRWSRASYLPRQPTRWPELVPGALFLTVGVLGLHIVTVYWIAHEVESKTDTYGAIGAALALLLWSYLLGSADHRRRPSSTRRCGSAARTARARRARASADARSIPRISRGGSVTLRRLDRTPRRALRRAGRGPMVEPSERI